MLFTRPRHKPLHSGGQLTLFLYQPAAQHRYAYVSNPKNNIDPTGYASFVRNVPLYIDDVFEKQVEQRSDGRTYMPGTDIAVRDFYGWLGYTVTWVPIGDTGYGEVRVYTPEDDDEHDHFGGGDVQSRNRLQTR